RSRAADDRGDGVRDRRPRVDRETAEIGDDGRHRGRRDEEARRGREDREDGNGRGAPHGAILAGSYTRPGVLALDGIRVIDQTGEGQLVDTSLLEAAMALTVWESAEYWVTGEAPKALGSAHRLAAPYQAIRASDG